MGWRFKICCAALLLLIALLLPRPDQGRLFELMAGTQLSDYLQEAVAPFREPGKAVTIRLSVRTLEVSGPGGAEAAGVLFRRIRECSRSLSDPEFSVELTDQDPTLQLSAQFFPEDGGFQYRLSFDEEDPLIPTPPPTEGRRRYQGRISLLPPLAAVLTALVFEKAVLGLFTGAFLGAWLLAAAALQLPGAGTTEALAAAAELPRAAYILFHDILFAKCLCDRFRLQILGFVFFLCAAVGVMIRMGGIQGLVDILGRRATTARSAQLATFLLGLAIFFDDYANTILVGCTMRPLTDRLRLAREKLAYIVDSTSAPVAGLAILSTWIAFEVSTFSAQLPEVPDLGLRPEDGYGLFVATLPTRFYCLFTLALVPLTIMLRREYGPMLAACRRALLTGELVRKEGRPMVAEAFTRMAARPGTQPRAVNVAIPVALLLGGTILGIALLGMESVQALFLASILSFGAASLLALVQRLLSPLEILAAACSTVRSLLFAFTILLLAWAIGTVCQDLGTAPTMVAALGGLLRPELLPLALFATSCLISFSTGSSWSTMAILLPNVVVLAGTLGKGTALGSEGLLILSIGAVLEGSIFGDHCSPISDTTILSSVAAASDHMDHTRTQIPYALLSMGAAVAAGYLPVALLGRAWWPLCLVAGILGMALLLLLAGKDPARGGLNRAS